MAPTTQSRGARALALAVAAAAVVPLLAGCTPRMAEIQVTNSTSVEIVLTEDGYLSGHVAAGDTTTVSLRGADEGGCTSRPVLAASVDRMRSVSLGTVCDGDHVRVAADDFDETSAVASVVNATETGLRVRLGGYESGLLAPGDRVIVPLQLPAGTCIDGTLDARSTGPEEDAVWAHSPERVCDGDEWVIAPEDLWRSVPGLGEVLIHPGSATVTNATEGDVEVTFGGVDLGVLHPGETRAVSPQHVAVGRCADEAVEVVPVGPGSVLIPMYGDAEVCDGDAWTLGPDGFDVVRAEPAQP